MTYLGWHVRKSRGKQSPVKQTFYELTQTVGSGVPTVQPSNVIGYIRDEPEITIPPVSPFARATRYACEPCNEHIIRGYQIKALIKEATRVNNRGRVMRLTAMAKYAFERGGAPGCAADVVMEAGLPGQRRDIYEKAGLYQLIGEEQPEISEIERDKILRNMIFRN